MIITNAEFNNLTHGFYWLTLPKVGGFTVEKEKELLQI